MTFQEHYACVNMQTGAECWPEYDVCSEPSASPDNECWCDLYWESPCPCNCRGLAPDACHQAACIDDACVVVPIDCDDDGNECTDDVCDDGSCTHPPEDDGTPCVDDNECTEDDTCQGGFCTSGPPVADGADCDDDGNECTDDECQGGSCTHPDKSNGTSCDDDGNECTDDECVDGTCTHPPEEDCTPCDQGLGWCVNEVCEPVECSLVSVEDVMACSGQQVQSPVVIGACQPYCVEDDQVILEGVGLPEGWTLTGSADCATGEGTATVIIPADAADGPYVLQVQGSLGQTACGSETMTVDVVKVELTYDSVPEADEENPGGFLCLNDDDDNDDDTPDRDDVGPTMGEDDLRPLTVSIAPEVTEGTVELSITEGADKVALYEDADRSGPVTLPDSWEVSELPVTLWVEGVETSLAPRDVRLKADYTGPDGPCFDEVYLTVIQVDLDVDSDRDGTISSDASDDVDEDTWTYGVGTNGAIILCNNDDDEGDASVNSNGNHEDDTINGPDDRNDLAPLMLRALVVDPVPGWSRVLEVSDRNKIRLFDEGANAVLGPGSTTNQYSIPDLLTVELEYRMEATQYPGDAADPSFDGLVTLSLVLEDPQSVERYRDTVVVRVAPFILLPNTASPLRILDSFVKTPSVLDAWPGICYVRIGVTL